MGTARLRHPEPARCSRQAVSAPAGASAPGAPSGLSRPLDSPPAPEAAAARRERSGGGAKLGAGRELKPPRTPHSRSRRVYPTSAETKIRKRGGEALGRQNAGGNSPGKSGKRP